MALEIIEEITSRYSVFWSLSANELEDSLECNICHILHEKDQQLTEIMEEEMTQWEQVLFLSWMHLQQAEEVKAQS